jgi:hypothetical protein
MTKARNTTKLIGNSGVVPGSYILSKLDLTTTKGQVFDIKQLVTGITITESIYMASIEAEIVILDGVNLFEELKLNGDEKIDMIIKIKELESGDTEKHNHTFYISEILDFARKRNGSSTYLLRCLSKHAYINNTKILTKNRSGTIGTIIKNICTSDLKIKDKYLDVNTSTSQSINCIIPSLRPFAAIKWLNTNAFTTTGAPFYFFETLNSGVKYKSYEDFVDSEPVTEYIHTPVLKNTIGSKEYFKETSRRIRKLSSDLNLSKYVATLEGAFASTTRSIDISTKSYTPKKYNYNNIKKLNSHNPFPANRSNNDHYDGKPLDRISDGKNYFISNNKHAYKNSNNFQSPSAIYMGMSQSYISTEETLIHDITVAGNFNIECGQTIRIKMNKTSAADNESDPIDKMQSGRYLISSIIHKFEDEYTLQMEVKTNSFGSDLADNLVLEDSDGKGTEVAE